MCVPHLCWAGIQMAQAPSALGELVISAPTLACTSHIYTQRSSGEDREKQDRKAAV